MSVNNSKWLSSLSLGRCPGQGCPGATIPVAQPALPLEVQDGDFESPGHVHRTFPAMHTMAVTPSEALSSLSHFAWNWTNINSCWVTALTLSALRPPHDTHHHHALGRVQDVDHRRAVPGCDLHRRVSSEERGQEKNTPINANTLPTLVRNRCVSAVLSRETSNVPYKTE